MTAKVLMYCVADLPKCTVAEQILESKGVAEIEKIYVDGYSQSSKEMWMITGRRTLPQIFIGETHVGDLDDLLDIYENGELDMLLNAD